MTRDELAQEWRERLEDFAQANQYLLPDKPQGVVPNIWFRSDPLLYSGVVPHLQPFRFADFVLF